MGNSFRPHFVFIIVTFLSFIICMSLAACTVSQSEMTQFLSQSQNNQGQSGQGGTPSQAGENRVSAEIHCPDIRRDDCNIKVTIHPVKEDVELDIMVFGEHGIRFLPNLDVLPANGGIGAIHRIRLLTGESRSVDFPYQPRIISGAQIDGEPDLPGAFVVDVVVTHTYTDDWYADTKVPAFMWLNDFGEFHLLNSLGAYKSRFEDAFTNGEHDVGYSIVMEEGARPYRGYIWVRADSIRDGYDPIIEIASTGAVEFLDDRIWAHTIDGTRTQAIVDFPPINDGGARVARIPFELDRNGRLLDGTYVFLVTIRDENMPNSADHETMPIVLELHSDPQYPNERWLTPVVSRAASATSTPQSATGGAIDDTLNAQNFNANTICEELEHVRFENEMTNQVHWTREISTFDGTLCEAYLAYVAFNVPLSWNEFKTTMLIINSNLTNADDTLKPYEIYIVPELDAK